VIVRYRDGRGVLRVVLAAVTSRAFAVTRVETQRTTADDGTVELTLDLEGRTDIKSLALALEGIEGVVSVHVGSLDELDE
jgi:acetolactate synthase regulatory subunit